MQDRSVPPACAVLVIAQGQMWFLNKNFALTGCGSSSGGTAFTNKG